MQHFIKKCVALVHNAQNAFIDAERYTIDLRAGLTTMSVMPRYRVLVV